MNDLLKLSIGNAKLDKKTIIFDIPAGKTCNNGAKDCHSWVNVDSSGKRTIKDGDNTVFRCYAASQEALFTNVYLKRKYNLDLLLNELKQDMGIYKCSELINKSIQKIRTKNITKIRVHSSGDFFNSCYLNAWLRVCKLNQDLKFYCYSKSLNLFGTNKTLPNNFYLTASMGGQHDRLIHMGFFKRYAIVVNSKEEAITKGIEHRNKPYLIDKDDSSCFKPDPFALLIHGVQPKKK